MKAAIAAFLLLWWAMPSAAETLRIALFNTELSQKGPGLLLRGLTGKSLPQAEAVIDVIAATDPDILILQDFDWDLEARALRAMQTRLSDRNLAYDYLFTARPNSGLPTGLDMDGDGRTGTARDAQSFGNFVGAHGIAVLSRYPLLEDQLVDFSAIVWRDLPWAKLPQHPNGTPFPSPEAQAQQRLSSTNHWILPVTLPNDAQLDLMIFKATPPVFDGTEDRNGKRNHDEIAFWRHILDGHLGLTLDNPVVLIGDANLDPELGEGLHGSIQSLLKHPRLHDPRPTNPSSLAATVEWDQTGPMRVDYILPDIALRILDAGVVWPTAPQDPAAVASRHRLVWVDIALP